VTHSIIDTPKAAKAALNVKDKHAVVASFHSTRFRLIVNLLHWQSLRTVANPVT